MAYLECFSAGDNSASPTATKVAYSTNTIVSGSGGTNLSMTGESEYASVSSSSVTFTKACRILINYDVVCIQYSTWCKMEIKKNGTTISGTIQADNGYHVNGSLVLDVVAGDVISATAWSRTTEGTNVPHYTVYALTTS